MRVTVLNPDGSDDGSYLFPEIRFRPCKKLAIADAAQMAHAFEVTTIDGNRARGRAGDYLMRDSAGHLYPCNRAVFEQTYRFVGPDPEDMDEELEGER